MSSEETYETLEKIGHGSFGIIRKVRRKADGFIMCRKEISYLRMSQKEREQLHAEFQILSHLRHPNIVAYYHREHLKLSQDLHLYMEYCGNGDLGRVIKDLQHKGQRAQESFVWSIFTQLIMALYRCHYGINLPEVGANVLGLTQGTASGNPKVPPGTMTILHRDLKPENVFLGDDNSVKLGDFGLSKMIKSHDFASTYVGTPFYMSPEICAAEKYTLKSDIWSVGCIIYELCAREPPFNAKTHYQLVQKIKEGRVAPLPEIYSAELYQVIKDCLRVNPDRRPNTAQLLNLPVVKLMRKEKEVVDLNKSLRAKEEAIRRKDQDLSERLARLDREKNAAREEMEASLRREWEVKARLEIDRLANAEIEQLQRRFEEEVRSRVEAELLKKKSVSFAPQERMAGPTSVPTTAEDATAAMAEYASSMARSKHARSSLGVSGDEFPSTTDLTELSLDSPDTSREKSRPSMRTPFCRAQTMFAGHATAASSTPMDVEMASPSPMVVASLSLSPRRNCVTRPPMTHTGNIFAADNAARGARSWDPERDGALLDSDDSDIVPSPTRRVKSSKNPFTAKDRPILTSQKSCPIQRLKTKTSHPGLVSKAAAGAGPKTGTSMARGTSPEARPRSPTRMMHSKIPSVSATQGEAGGNGSSGSGGSSGGGVGGFARKPSVMTRKTSSGEALTKVAAKNNIRGRTLVELQQARAGGRPVSMVVPPTSTGDNMSPKRGPTRDGEGVAVWDPERDEMPSPFLVRRRRSGRT